MAAHRYWRVLITNTEDSWATGYTQLQDIYFIDDPYSSTMYPAKQSATTAANVLCSSVTSNYPAYAAFDRTTAIWRSAATTTPTEEWIGIDLGVGGERDFVGMIIDSHAAAGMVTEGSVQYSDDGTTWVAYWPFSTSVTYAASGGDITYWADWYTPFPNEPKPAPRRARYWRMVYSQSNAAPLATRTALGEFGLINHKGEVVGRPSVPPRNHAWPELIWNPETRGPMEGAANWRNFRTNRVNGIRRYTGTVDNQVGAFVFAGAELTTEGDVSTYPPVTIGDTEWLEFTVNADAVNRYLYVRYTQNCGTTSGVTIYVDGEALYTKLGTPSGFQEVALDLGAEGGERVIRITFNIAASGGSRFIQFSDIRLAGPSSYAATPTGETSAYLIAKAFDGSVATYYRTAANAAFPRTVSFDVGVVPQQINGLYFQIPSAAIVTQQYPRLGSVEYSDDNVTWHHYFNWWHGRTGPVAVSEVLTVYAVNPPDDPPYLAPPAPPAAASEPPTITSPNTGSVPENALASIPIHQAAATEASGGAIRWALSGADASLLTIDEQGAVYLKSPADHEVKASYVFTLDATSSGGTTSQGVTITVTDVSDTVHFHRTYVIYAYVGSTAAEQPPTEPLAPKVRRQLLMM